MFGNPRFNRHASKSLIQDQKNKLTYPNPTLKAAFPKTVTTRAQARRGQSPKSSTKASTTLSQCSPPKLVSLQIETNFNHFSKSVETSAEQESHKSQHSPKEKGWKGILLDYKGQITDYLQHREFDFKIDGSYITHGHLISPKMRSYLLKHMVKISNKFDLLRVTLHSAVHYLDMYFAKRIIPKDQMEVVFIAQACLFMAMKYEEIYPPDLSDWVDRKHKDKVIKMEAQIVKSLDFQLAHYTTEHYLQMIQWEQGYEDDDEYSQLLSDLSLFDMKIREFPPSSIARAIFCMSKKEKAVDHKIQLSVKWMIERNQESIEWLKEQQEKRRKYSLF